MTVKFEVKGNLARLLATEDIVVEHKKVDTACFDVQKRVLTLPMWEKATDSIYTMLVLHEISHALWTPNEDWSKDLKVPMSFVNIVEDARVEKFCKRKYPGSPKSFFAGYKELQEQDFFCIGDTDVSKMNLADRVNLYFKVGNFINIDFTDEEREIVDLIYSSETFADVLIAAEELYKYCKEEMLDQQQVDCSQGSGVSSGNDYVQQQNSKSEETEDSEKSESSSKKEVPTDQTSNQFDQNHKKDNQEKDNQEKDNLKNEPKVHTVDALKDNIDQLVDNSSSITSYVEIQDLDLHSVIISNKEIHKHANIHFKNLNTKDYIKTVDSKFKEFKKSSQKEVGYLVKEFECRKAADAYSRSSTARTGVLDTSRLHSYIFSEDLFKKISVIPEGKNHGLIFILDWSGSMADVLLDTCKQLFNLIWFCRKVSIPFEVYAFTNEYKVCHYDAVTGEYVAAKFKPLYTKREGIFHIPEDFSLMNIFTSKVSSSDLEKQMINIWRIASYYSNRYYSISNFVPSRMSLSGTPLNESLIALHQIIPKFQMENRLQKVQCVILTDGEAGGLGFYGHKIIRADNSYYYSVSNICGSNVFLRDRKLGTVYDLQSRSYSHFTKKLLLNLRDKFSDTNFIGIRILSSGNAGSFIREHVDYNAPEYDKIKQNWEKNKSFSIYNSGYHVYFGLSSTSLSQDSNMCVNENASISQIKSAFAKSLKSKKMNKKILGEFIDLVV